MKVVAGPRDATLSGNWSYTTTGPVTAIVPSTLAPPTLRKGGADHAMVAVDQALEVAAVQAGDRQRRGGAGSAEHDRVGSFRQHFQHLRLGGGVGAGVALVRHDLNSGLVGGGLGGVIDLIAKAVGEADIGHGLDAMRLHVVDVGVDHKADRLHGGKGVGDTSPRRSRSAR